MSKCEFNSADRRTITDCEQRVNANIRMALANFRASKPEQSSFMFPNIGALITQAVILEQTSRSASTIEEQETITKTVENKRVSKSKKTLRKGKTSVNTIDGSNNNKSKSKRKDKVKLEY